MKTFRVCLLVLIGAAFAPVSMAALRGYSGVGNSAACTAPCTFSDTYAGANAIQAGDLILIVTDFGTGGLGEGTVTDPSGFSPGSSLSPALADLSIDSGNEYLHLAAKIATSADAGFPAYSTTLQSGTNYSQQIIVLSGRPGTLAAALDNQVETASSAETATPYSYSLTGLTALSGDDKIVIVGLAVPYGNAGYSYSAAISGYTNNLNTAGTANYSPPILTLSELDSTSGAFGPLSATITASSSTTVASGGFVLSIPAASVGPTAGVVLSNGKVLLSNGKPVIN